MKPTGGAAAAGGSACCSSTAYRGNQGHASDVCRNCSTTAAMDHLDQCTPEVQWLVEDLRRQLRQERLDRADDARWAAAEMRDG